ncbi:cell division protein FtsX [Alkalitalea saponilacus]|uniref:Cell division protein FtsX n=1 Tax=Alkalitalea saponilacus TaxID=889453 RepID=A0A1T5E631_9BACT|nr:permease-like cell division protein FtsX [Alkalitalea saponilacus]ASB49098.1 cell division protein FtsX [Alkalitalea saponilacus]SKB79339.1 cell division transport system permease protein [Alkalitalea saponilacus]
MSSSIARRKLRSSYATTIISISLVLFLLGIIGFLFLNANRLSTYIKENLGFTILINDNAREAEVVRLQTILNAAPYVRIAEYINKDQAADALKEELGEDFVEFLGYNPLLASIEVKLAAQWANPDSMARIEAQIMSFPQVKEVYYQKNLLDAINENIRKITLVLGVFSLLLLVISIALINNTIRLSVYSKRFLIKTMQLVGATKGFIRRPFLWKSLLHGLAGATVAIVLLSLMIYGLSNELDGVIGFSNIILIGLLFLIVILLGLMITFVSTFFAVNKYLRLKTDQLYY